MKIRVSEATQLQLDYLVTSIEAPDALKYGVADWREQRRSVARRGEYLHRWSSSWMQGGPILSKLGAENGLQLTTHVTSTAAACGWRASCDFPNGFYFGETALIAAMRCYVASKLGNEVEVPEELV